MWSYSSPAWDAMCEEAVLIARSIGIPAITGERYLRHLELGNDKTHARQNENYNALFLAVFEDVRNAAYAIVPNGSFLDADARHQLRGDAALAPSTKVRGGGPPPLPPGSMGGSSTDPIKAAPLAPPKHPATKYGAPLPPAGPIP